LNRVLRKWWRELPPNKRQLFIEWFFRNKWKIGLIFASIISLFYLYYLSHIQETPITKRKRFIAFTPKQLLAINNYEFEVQLELFRSKLLPNNHHLTQRVAKIATQLINGNSDLNQIHDHEWSISVIDEPKIKNAFVVPSGQIFVFTGMLSMCDNDQQLGVILAHEMAHAVLAHGAELVIKLFY
jgi:predicted Zn-dependent protease